MTHTIHHGDCLDVLRGMPDNSVDAVVCDPPYGLSNTTPDKVTETIIRWAQGDREYVPQGKGFMGASWDAFVPPVAVWDECLRVLKPGGHLVAFAGSRTQDLMGLSIRLAGFDIRENLAWLYGSGFPKSLDVSKAIDKAAGAEREVVGRNEKLMKYMPNGNTGAFLMGGYRSVEELEAAAERDEVTPDGANRARAVLARRNAHEQKFNITAPGTPEAEKWQGWGTALKPAHEPIILARKPIQGTVAANTLTWGTGGLNIDKTRIGTTDNTVRPTTGGSFLKDGFSTIAELEAAAERGEKTPNGRDARATLARARANQGRTDGGHAAGRWPANVVLDPDTAKVLDQQSGTTKSQTIKATAGGSFLLHGCQSIEHLRALAEAGEKTPDGRDAKATLDRFNSHGTATRGHNDEGGASRFFKVVEPDPPFMYAAKAPKRERPSYTSEDGQTVQHSTVKPLSIMQWLVKLVTPEGGTVLDPFAGSGTTVEAAILEGFNVIGIEREEAYLPLIQQRIDRASDVLPMAS